MNIAVIGAGTMGNGIAHVFALSGNQVSLIDVNPVALENAKTTIEKNLTRQVAKDKISEVDKAMASGRIQYYTEMKSALTDCELAVEAVTENEDVKLSIFKQLDQNCPESCILASNTSSISITKIANVTDRPDKVIGMHFMNPVPVMKLVEVISGYETSQETLDTILEVTEKLGKVPLAVNDYPGFIANRILMPMINEAIYSLWQGVAGVEEIDGIMKLGMAHPMGPLQLADFIGLDVCLSILRVLQDGLGIDKYAPCPLLVNMVASGNLGRKTGSGFYEYVKGSKESKVSKMFL